MSANQRIILGKKVNKLRREGLVPANVFGKNIDSCHISVNLKEFLKVFKEAGESGLVNLKVGDGSIKPVLIREVQVHTLTREPLHIDFYQVNLTEKVEVKVPIVLEGEEPEIVHTSEAVVIQPISEIGVRALPTELPEDIKVNISTLKAINDAIMVSQLNVPQGVEIMADQEAVVVKLDNAVTEEMQKLLEEQQSEAQAAAEAAQPEGGEAEGEAKEGEAPEEDGEPSENKAGEPSSSGEAPQEENK